MDRHSWLLIWVVVIAIQGAISKAERPNVLLIMADDLGYSDLGCYGSKIQTPHLDQLANDGLRFTQFYNTGRCWPTRAALLTGYYPQSIRRDKILGIPSGNRGKRPPWAPLICGPLGQVGYRTYHTGKWHLDDTPIASGFDRSYWMRDHSRFFSPTVHRKNDVPLPAIPVDTDYYTTVAMGDHAVECLQEHAASHQDQPFFHYLAFTAPHFPLQALPEDIDKYRDIYQVGWDAIRKARWQRIQEIGLVDGKLSEVMPQLGPPYDFPEAMQKLGGDEINRPLPWDSLTDSQQEFQSTKMAIHAAMIDCMDRQIGRVLDQIRAMNQFENTLVLFLSDNGASAEIMVRGDGHDPAAPMGSWSSYLCLGPGWSTACNAPFRFHKTWTHEGGIATPLVVHWPHGIKARGELRRQPSHVIDLWPTLMELTGAKATSEMTRPGRSLVETFQQDTEHQRDLWWLHQGNRALRRGDWKISAVSGGDWELYQLSQDRAETEDLAATNPGKLSALRQRWEAMNKQHQTMASSSSGR